MEVPHLPSLLWLEDSEDDFIIFSRSLRTNGLETEEVHLLSEEDELVTALDSKRWDVVLADFNLPGLSPTRVLEILRERDLDIPVLVLSGLIRSEDTILLMREGVRDIILKDDISRLVPAILREIEEATIRRERSVARSTIEDRNRDLTEALKKLEEAHDDITRLQRSRALGEIARGMTHHFNNLLMRGNGLLERLAEFASVSEIDASHARALDSLREIFHEGGEMMKRFAEFNSEKSIEGTDLVAIERVVLAAVEEFRAELDRKGIEFIFVDEAVGNVMGDEVRLTKAIRNVIRNSIEAMPEGGRLAVSAKPNGGGKVLLQIADTGKGMNREILRRCLEPFYSTKGEFGTGIGLSLSESIVQQQGGFLSVESIPDCGTIVSIILRKVDLNFDEEPTGQIQPRMVKDSVHPGDFRILVVEDEPVIADLVGRFLKRDGFQVEIAGSGVNALRMFDDGDFDMIISDRSMPGMNGDELARLVKERDPNTPILMLTGFGDLMKNQGDWPYGVDSILSKPVDSKTILREVRTMLGIGEDVRMAC